MNPRGLAGWEKKGEGAVHDPVSSVLKPRGGYSQYHPHSVRREGYWRNGYAIPPQRGSPRARLPHYGRRPVPLPLLRRTHHARAFIHLPRAHRGPLHRPRPPLQLGSISEILSAGKCIGLATGPASLLRAIDATPQRRICDPRRSRRPSCCSSSPHARRVGLYRVKRDVFEVKMQRHLAGLAVWTPPLSGLFFWCVDSGFRPTIALPECAFAGSSYCYRMVATRRRRSALGRSSDVCLHCPAQCSCRMGARRHMSALRSAYSPRQIGT
jgi:hypothetical protein